MNTRSYSELIPTSAGRQALIIIDAQTIFCSNDPMMWGNDETHRAALDLARILPAFRAAGIPVYIVTYEPGPSNVPFHELYLIRPDERDTLVEKYGRSAFKGTQLQSLLNRNGHDTLILCGFDQSVCVYETALDAIASGRTVLLLRDLTADGKALTAEIRERHLQELLCRGVSFSTSDVFLKERSRQADLRVGGVSGTEPSMKKPAYPSLRL